MKTSTEGAVSGAKVPRCMHGSLLARCKTCAQIVKAEREMLMDQARQASRLMRGLGLKAVANTIDDLRSAAEAVGEGK